MRRSKRFRSVEKPIEILPLTFPRAMTPMNQPAEIYAAPSPAAKRSYLAPLAAALGTAALAVTVAGLSAAFEQTRNVASGGYREVGFDVLSGFPATVVYGNVNSNTPS